MENKKYQIFVSSTYKDLITARTKVIATILSLYHFPIGMEMYSADDDEQWQVIKETIDISDYYIVIIGHRYGSLTKEGISFTEKEFQYAKSKGIPILSFIRERDISTIPEERETDQAIQIKLDEFIKKAKSDKMCDFWKNEDELGAKVAVALSKYFGKRPRVGWKRSDSIASPQILEEMSKLSKENRDLRDELATAYQQLEKRKPDLVVDINNDSRIVLEFQKKLDGKIEKAKKRPNVNYNLIGSQLRPFVKKSEIEFYNDSLPTDEDVDKFNLEMITYHRLRETTQEVKIILSNRGTMRATDIHIDFAVPEGLIILEEDVLKNIEMPSITFPQNPLIAAENKMLANEKGLEGIPEIIVPSNLSQMSSVVNIPAMLGSSKFQIRDIRNKYTIHYDSLLHTRYVDFEYFICPMKRGLFKILFSIICDEYPNEEVVETQIEVI
jgi:hypothetical protein